MIDGAMLIGAAQEQSLVRFSSYNPATNAALSGDFSSAGVVEAERASKLAAEAFPSYAATDLETRARFLESAADAILAIGDELIERAMAETGLPRARLEGERGRTVGQLKLFASVVRQGDFLDATVDSALPDRQPAPRPDLRRMNLPVGPVVVFGASNFPLAFS